MEERFKQFIEASSRILITSHVSPDPDAVCSLLLLGGTLKLNYPDKQVLMALDEEPSDLSFITGYEQIKFQPLLEAVQEFQPELAIMVDANGFERCCRQGGPEIKSYIASNDVKSVIIDHHEPDGRDEVDLYINSGNPACAQEVYELCFEKLNLKKPENYAQTTMLGLYADSGGFIYRNSRYKETLQLVSELVGAGANIEVAKNRLNQYTDDQMIVIGELSSKISHVDDYTYSYISDAFVKGWQQDGKPVASLHTACKQFIDTYIRNIDDRHWGFLVYPDPLEGENMYSVSLRSIGGVKDVSQIAIKLNGGGHKPSAGGRVQAASIQEAIDKVKAVIAETV